MNKQPKAGIDSRNAPHSTLQLGHRVEPQEFYSRQQVRRMLFVKAKAEVATVRVRGRLLTRDGRAWAGAEMVKRWMVQIQRECEKKSIHGGYPVYLVDSIVLMQNIHDEVVEGALLCS